MSEAFFCSGNLRFNEVNAAILREQVKRLDAILARLRQARRLFREGLRLPEGLRWVKSNDEDGDCGVCFLIQASDAALAEKVEAVIKPHLAAHRPINSGRHVYSAWSVVNGKVGGHHPDWDCFRHPKNRGIRTNYAQPLRWTNDYLSRTILCATPYGWSPRRIRKTIEELNAQWSL
jgi:hypothetical protein